LINNRQQSGRRRGRGGQNGQRPQNGRPELGNRIDNRARGNAPQLLEKYKTLARDAQQAGDRVLAEYYFQFADHYFRVLAESRARFEEANPNRPRQDYAEQEEQFDEDGNEIEREFDARPPQQNRQEQAPRQDRYQRDDRPRDDRPRDDRPRDDRPREDRPQRNEQNRSDQNRDDRPARQDREARPERTADDRPVRQDRYQRDDRPREDRPRDDRPREERPRLDRARASAPRARAPETTQDDDGDHSDSLPFDALPPAINVAAMEPVVGVEGEPVVVPKKRGRPKKVVVEAVTED
jgi:hypothetical protein